MTDSAYQQQLIEKQDYLQSLFQGITLPAWEVFPSPEQHYRMRAEFRIWHEGDTLSYAMFERGQKASRASLIRLTEFPAASSQINTLMPTLLAELSRQECLKQRLYQCEFLSTLSGEILVSLIYHKKLDEMGMKIVGLEKVRPHIHLERAVMAIRFSEEIFGTQFHPEANPEGMIENLKDDKNKNAMIENYGVEKYLETLDRMDDPDKILLTQAQILPRFLQNVAEQILKVYEMA